MKIRNASPSDSKAIATLLAWLGYPGTEPFIEEHVAQQLVHADARLFVATEGEQLLGFLSLHFIPQLALRGEFCRISYFCVSPDARNHGIGAALEAEAVRLARERGCDRIELHSHARREDAHRFYYRQGYVESPKYLVKPLTPTASS